MILKNSKNNINLAKKWLKQIIYPAKKFIIIIMLTQILGTLLLIKQLYLLSYIPYFIYIKKTSEYKIYIYLIIIICLIFIRSIISWIKEIMNYKVATIVKKQVREDILNHISQIGYLELNKISNANIITTAMEEVESLTNFLTKFLPQIFMSMLAPLIILFFIFFENIICGIILLLYTPFIITFMILIGLGTEFENQKHFKELIKMSSIFLDTIKGLITLKLFNKSKIYINNIFLASDNYRIKIMKILKIAFFSSAVLEFFTSISIALIAIYLGLGFINIPLKNYILWSLNNITLQKGLFILLLSAEFFIPLRELNMHYHAKAEALGAALEINKFLKIKNFYHNKNILFTNKVYNIKIKNLTVKYNNRIILKNIFLEIKNKEKIAIIGTSGVGKTTLINTILGFLKYEGNIIINNTYELKHIHEKYWLKNISWLGQNSFLFKNTIKDNLILGNRNITNKEIIKALTNSDIKEFIKSLDCGLYSKIGEQNVGLSIGQIQKLALARSYLKKNNILILDEPTISLDKNSENNIIQALKINWRNKTVIISTHKLNFLKYMDKIIVLSDGKITEIGSLTKLINNKNSKFYNLYKNEAII